MFRRVLSPEPLVPTTAPVDDGLRGKKCFSLGG